MENVAKNSKGKRKGRSIVLAEPSFSKRQIEKAAYERGLANGLAKSKISPTVQNRGNIAPPTVTNRGVTGDTAKNTEGEISAQEDLSNARRNLKRAKDEGDKYLDKLMEQRVTELEAKADLSRTPEIRLLSYRAKKRHQAKVIETIKEKMGTLEK